MHVTNPLGLVFAFSSSGAVRKVEVDPIRIGLRPPSPLGRSGANLYLRKRGNPIAYTPLLGPDSPSQYRAAEGCFEARGSWAGLEYECLLQLAASHLSWQWRVRVESRLDHGVELDLIYVQDVGLRAAGAGLVNEHYVSQYIERRVFEDPRHGHVICCRQNMKEAVGHPWLMLACVGRAVAASTDGLQFYGRTFRSTGEPEALGAGELQGELAGEASVVALQGAPFVLSPGQSHTGGFVATYLPDHPQASSDSDLQRLPALVEAFAGAATSSAALAALRGSAASERPVRSRFHGPRLLPAEDLSHGELVELFGGAWRHIEQADGRLLAFSTDGPSHVVLRAKEERVDRPHGHILQTRCGYVPDERIMSTTAFACGVFNSHLTQGNTNFNTFLSVCTNPVVPGLEGQRMLVQLDDGEYLLGVPSAFEMGLNHCRWIYKRGSVCLEVYTWTASREPRVNLAFKVRSGGAVRLWVTHQFDDANGWTVAPSSTDQFVATPRAGSMVATQFASPQLRIVVNDRDCAYRAHGDDLLDGESPTGSLFVIEIPETSAFSMSFIGELDGPIHPEIIRDVDARRRSDCEGSVAAWRALSRELALSGPQAIAAIREILPWYGMNALVHFLTPYGLEQFSGAAWGTRDVCQGPVELLLCAERYAEAKHVLRILFSRQNPDGGWPQWWMFDRYAFVRADDAHGDVVYWCILALCSYVRASGDFGVLDEPLPYFDAEGTGRSPTTPLVEHVDRIIDLVVRSFVPGTALVRFGGGDWNDSLQPVSKELAQRLISSWTVQMCYQAFSEYREVCERGGRVDQAKRLGDIAERIHADFHRYLVRDGVVAGYGRVGAAEQARGEITDADIDVLLHPTDAQTGVEYSLLPMNRGVISGMFDRPRAEHHLALIEQHLKGPDGARLMNRPLRYTGGTQTLFQRAESSTYFGREIGLMYVHEHLRYAEAQARMGRAEAFLRALRQAIPVDQHEVVPQADLRQANCYYSSSDVLFPSRYAADTRYAEVILGNMPLKGGWRVYSSGPGIFIALVVSRLLGLRIEFGDLILDPVMARSLDGLRASLQFRGRPVTFVYRVSGSGFGPRAVSINGQLASFDREDNPYRQGGAVVPLERFMAMLGPDANCVEIEV